MYRTPGKGDLQYFDNVARDQELRVLRRRVAEYENGDAYKKEQARSEKWRKRYERERAARKKDKAAAEKELRKVANIWYQAALDEYTERMKVQAENDRLRKENEMLKAENGSLRKESDDKSAANEMLMHKMSSNHTNSNMPSSQDRPEAAPAKDQVRNSREPSDKKRGAQPGHKHHPRRKPAPTAPPVWHDERPADTLGEDGWYRTDRYIEKLEVTARLVVDVIPHRAYVWRNRIDDRQRTSPFPEGLHDEVNYSKQTEAMVLMLTHTAHVAGRKVKQMLYELTDGALDVSTGWIAGIPRKFSKRCTSEINQIFHDLFESPYLHVDSTVTKNNGKREAVTVACSPVSKAVFFAHTEKKGKQAADALPCAQGMGYKGDVISDREAVFLVLGQLHQQCLAHHSRKLKSIIEIEDCEWAKNMRELFHEMLTASHEWPGWSGDGVYTGGPSAEQVKDWEARYDDILKAGRDYYCKNPPTRHYLDGHNTRAQLAEDKDQVLLFIHKPWIPATNNMAERCLRAHKRELHQSTTFRSSESIDDRCNVASVVQTARLRDRQIYQLLTEILSRSPGQKEPETSDQS